jgi:hypothetical protein
VSKSSFAYTHAFGSCKVDEIFSLLALYAINGVLGVLITKVRFSCYKILQRCAMYVG